MVCLAVLIAAVITLAAVGFYVLVQRAEQAG